MEHTGKVIKNRTKDRFDNGERYYATLLHPFSSTLMLNFEW